MRQGLLACIHVSKHTYEVVVVEGSVTIQLKFSLYRRGKHGQNNLR